jgi:hypothetical protein
VRRLEMAYELETPSRRRHERPLTSPLTARSPISHMMTTDLATGPYRYADVPWSICSSYVTNMVDVTVLRREGDIQIVVVV